jgi:hypothetical protein
VNIIADESVDRFIVERLRHLGYEVEYIAEISPGISDELVLRKANQVPGLLLTGDKDFGEMVFKEGASASAGIILIRLSGLETSVKIQTVVKVFEDHGDELMNYFTVISPHGVRLRRKTQ